MSGQVIGVATLQAAEGQSLNFAVPAERITQLKITELQTFSSLSAETQKNKRSAAERLYSARSCTFAGMIMLEHCRISNEPLRPIRITLRHGIRPAIAYGVLGNAR